MRWWRRAWPYSAYAQLLRRSLGRWAERSVVAAPIAVVCAAVARVAGNTFVSYLSPAMRLAVPALVFVLVLLMGLLPQAYGRSWRAPWHGALVALLLCGLSWPLWNRPSNEALVSVAADSRKVPRIILLVVDTLRRDAVSAFGGEVKTPEMDRLASDSVVFTNAYSPAPWTFPAVVSLMTGVHPFVHGGLRPYRVIPPMLPTLAELLAEQGYAAHSIGHNPFLGDLRGLGTGGQRGFPAPRFAPRAQGPHLLVSPWMYEVFHRELSSYFTTREIGDMASDWIGGTQESDFFLWVHFFDPHLPLRPESEYLRRTRGEDSPWTSLEYRDIAEQKGRLAEQASAIRDLYSAEVLGVDAAIGNILETLRENGLYEDSLIILTSDHGEEFWEHGGMEHGHTLYNELLAVPLLIKLPAGQGYTVVEDAVSISDVFPTVLEMVGTEFDSTMLTARDLAPYWSRDSEQLQARPIVSTGIDGSRQADAVLFDGYKYIRWRRSGREELYDLGQDAAEANNVAVAYPELAQRGAALIEKQKDDADDLRQRWGLHANHERDFDQTGLHILRTLGYLK